MKGDKKFLAATLLFLTMLSVFFYHFVHLDNIAEIESLEDKISKNNEKIVLITKFNNTHKNIDDEVANLAERHFIVTGAFPQNSDDEKIIDCLRETAMNNKLEVLNLDINNEEDNKKNDDKKNQKNYFTTNYNIKVRGDYFHINDFLFDVYNNHNFFDVKKINLKNSDGILTLDLVINCYYDT